MRLISTRRVAAAVAMFAVTVPAWAAAQSGIAAVWVPAHTTFFFQGLATHYSCGALRDEVAHLLSRLGPRHLTVREQACPTPGVTSFPGVTARMEVLIPADQADTKGPVVQAHWHRVVLVPAKAGSSAQSECELVRQFKEKFLPLFRAQGIRYESNCYPSQATLLGPRLSVEVLVPDK
jgi:hypothetical protein